MTTMLAVRLPEATNRRLRDRARKLGTTPSALVRSLLDRELGPAQDERSLLDQTRRWVGVLHEKNVPAGRTAREALLRWRPDRRA